MKESNQMFVEYVWCGKKRKVEILDIIEINYSNAHICPLWFENHLYMGDTRLRLINGRD